jgi:hypothetical protein
LVSRDVYINAVLRNVPRLLGLLNRNISSSSYGCFDREYWHYNTVDFACARKQEAVLTLTLMYLIEHDKNRYFHSEEILEYIRAALMFWTRIQNGNGSFNEWYPNENSFVVTSFSTYAVSESLLLLEGLVPDNEFQRVIEALRKAGDWLIDRHETRVMNQQTGAAIALLNLHLLTHESAYLESSREKIHLLHERQSHEGWFLEYGGPDIGYLSLSIDYLSKYFHKTGDDRAKEIIDRSLTFIRYFIHPDFIAGGEYTSRNTEYLIPHGFEIYSRFNDEASFIASMIRRALSRSEWFPDLFDDRYLTYVGYTWLQAYMDANHENLDDIIYKHFNRSFQVYFKEAGLFVVNDNYRHLTVNVKKGGAFKLYDKQAKRSYSDSGILVRSGKSWYTSGWLTETRHVLNGSSVTVSGNMWKVPDRSLNPLTNILLRLFQITFGRSSVISLWIKERLRDLLITETKPSHISYNRKMVFRESSEELLAITDDVMSDRESISSATVFAKDTHIYVPSSRYYTGMKGPAYHRRFDTPLKQTEIKWKIMKSAGPEFPP